MQGDEGASIAMLKVLQKQNSITSCIQAFPALRRQIARHKKQSHEYGADRFLVTACNSDRVAFQILAQSGTGTTEEDERLLLHFYPAMGLFLQHEHQATLLARCFHF